MLMQQWVHVDMPVIIGQAFMSWTGSLGEHQRDSTVYSTPEQQDCEKDTEGRSRIT